MATAAAGSTAGVRRVSKGRTRAEAWNNVPLLGALSPLEVRGVDLHCSSVADAHEIPAVEIRPEMISHMVSRPFALRGSVFVVLKCNR